MDLVAFLRARLDEDEQVAREARKMEQYVPGTDRWYQPFGGNGCPAPTVSMAPHRAVADVEAKRRIVERYAETEKRADNYIRNGLSSEPDDEVAERLALEWCCRMLALSDAEHPDYQPEWKS